MSATVLDAPNTQPADLLAQAVKQVNETFSQKGQSLYASFEKDKDTGISVVKIVDKKTNETISQLPPKQMVAFAQSMEASQAMHGKLLHYKA
ncbi:MAG: flagellar protein FlaG [Nitrosomonadales bacterium]|nr:flagellar protein FlaG [Nitrosomonadales bacterium]